MNQKKNFDLEDNPFNILFNFITVPPRRRVSSGANPHCEISRSHFKEKINVVVSSIPRISFMYFFFFSNLIRLFIFSFCYRLPKLAVSAKLIFCLLMVRHFVAHNYNFIKRSMVYKQHINIIHRDPSTPSMSEL
jgi:hypothetical protein